MNSPKIKLTAVKKNNSPQKVVKMQKTFSKVWKVVGNKPGRRLLPKTATPKKPGDFDKLKPKDSGVREVAQIDNWAKKEQKNFGWCCQKCSLRDEQNIEQFFFENFAVRGQKVKMLQKKKTTFEGKTSLS